MSSSVSAWLCAGITGTQAQNDYYNLYNEYTVYNY